MSQLLDQVRDRVRTLHYSIRTEDAYLKWIREFIIFHGKRHPGQMGASEISTFLSYLAIKRKVAASTQNQALAALLFLYKQVLDQEIEWVMEVERAKRSKRLPVVFTKEEVQAVLGYLKDEK